MKKIILPNFDYKKMEREINKQWYDRQKGNLGVVVLSINETVEEIGQRVQDFLKSNIDDNLNFSIYMNEEGIINYYLGYSIGGGINWSIKISSLDNKGYDENYNFAKNCINKVLSDLTVENLKLCKEYEKLIVESKDKYPLRIMYGDSECINVGKAISVPGELITYKKYGDIIKYFVRNTNKIMKRREKACYGRYFFKNMIVNRSEVRKAISGIIYKELSEEFKVC